MSQVLVVKSRLLEMEILPNVAGRVAALRFGTENFLSAPDVHRDNWGATYWTSPQVDWGWPPVQEVDILPYEVLSNTAEEVTLRSRLAEFGGRRLTIEKRFRSGPEGTIDTEYIIENCGLDSFKMAGWEISRVPPGGLTFFPTGSAELTPIAPHFELDTERFEGTTFYDHSRFEVGKCRKLHSDGRGGYLAHLHRNYLILKVFEDSTPEDQAPGEGECEIFANDDGKYVEIEVQGKYATIESGVRSSFVVRTAIERLPDIILREDRRALRKFADEKAASLQL